MVDLGIDQTEPIDPLAAARESTRHLEGDEPSERVPGQRIRPAVDCDFGSAPAAAIADTAGTVTFTATDPNHALQPFVGASPQGLFNCLPPGGASPKNDLTDFRDCQVRVSSNNTRSTSDQVFVHLRLPGI